MSKTIATENAPAAIGPYVQGVDLGNMIITSGPVSYTHLTLPTNSRV